MIFEIANICRLVSEMRYQNKIICYFTNDLCILYVPIVINGKSYLHGILAR